MRDSKSYRNKGVLSLVVIAFIFSCSNKPAEVSQKPTQTIQEVAKQEDSKVTDLNVIGRWVDSGIGKITIYRISDNDEYIFEEVFLDRSKMMKGLNELPSSDGRRFDYCAGSTTGDHYIINTEGDLEIRDNEGLITIATKSD